MKRTERLLAIGILLVSTALPGAATEITAPGHDPGDEMFREGLRPYGEWIDLEPGLVVWRPLHVNRHWRPYAEGRWVWTRHGWYWLSDEPFGWAVFHYGRWTFDDRFGWIWYPGSVWGPAWVEWRYNDAYIGWAPLPPTAIFHATFGIRHTRYWVAPASSWCFVTYRKFGHTSAYREYASVDEVRRMIGTSRRGSAYAVGRDGVVNRGIDRQLVERRSGTRIQQFDVRDRTSTGRDQIRSGVIETYRPDREQRSRERVSPSEQRPGRAEPIMRAPENRDDRRRETTRPERSTAPQEQRSVSPRPSDRRVAPNVRQPSGRTQPAPATRESGNRTGKKKER